MERFIEAKRLKFFLLNNRTAESALQLRKAVRLVWDSAPSWTAASVLLIFVQAALPLAALYLTKLIVDSVVLGPESSSSVYILVALAALVALLAAAASSATEVIGEAQSALVTDRIQEILHAKSVEVDLEYYENPKYYENLHRAQQDAIHRPAKIVNGLLQAGRSGVSLLAVTALIVSLSWIVALVLILTGIPTAYSRWKYSRKLYLWQRDCTAKERKAWYHHWLLTGYDYAKEVRLFGLAPKFMGRYRNLRKIIRDERLSIILKRSAADLAAQGVAIVVVFATLAYIAHQALLGAITVGAMVMYFGAIQQSRSFLYGFFTSLSSLYENNLFLTNLYEFLDLEPKVAEPLTPRPVPRPIQSGIRFSNVSFRYAGSEREVLRGVDITIRPGETVALVGENGSGKSTIAKLLCRLYDPTEGEITIDGVDLREFDTAELRREIGVLFQDYARYHFAAGENINLGRFDGGLEGKFDGGFDRGLEGRSEGGLDGHRNAETVRAAELAGADGFISRLEKGYDTVLGRWFDEGTELSSGEWQKVALARAFIRDSQIIILDEPTSSFDPLAEDELIGRFKDLSRGKMALLISHRLSTASMADRIYLLNAGQVVERGTHQELMEVGGRYARMFEVQAKRYRGS